MKHRLAAAMALASLLLVALPALTLAHPLGNFTINHYAGIRVSPTGIDLDVVIDEAEIPTFQARQDLDTDGDGEVSDGEAEAARVPQCTTLEQSLSLSVGAPSAVMPLELTEAGLEFPTGAGGLPTMRLVCEFRAAQTAALPDGAVITFADRSFGERIGWREMTVVGDGVSISGMAPAASLPSTSVSDRLTHYPTDLLQQPLAVSSVSFVASRGGAAAVPFSAPDARPLPGFAAAAGTAAAAPSAETVSAAVVGSGGTGVPGGIGDEIDGLLRTRDLTPLVLLGSILAAFALGAGHAITPGHGKTLMGAYLVGARGTPIHALGLGLSVAVSHTLGILGLALVVLAAGATLPPDEFQRLAPIVSAVTLTAVGGWLLVGQLRRLRRTPARAREQGHDHGHGNDHGHAHDHALLAHTHAHPPEPAGSLSWRSLFVLGLAGGLVPSANALIILLATIATDRPAFGLVLVVAFGAGMAGVMAGVGLALIYARDWIESRPRLPAFSRVAGLAPPVAAVFVLALGVVLTAQAVGTARL